MQNLYFFLFFLYFLYFYLYMYFLYIYIFVYLYMNAAAFGRRPGTSTQVVRLFTFLRSFAFSFYTYKVCTDHLRQRKTFGHWTLLY